MEPIDMKLVVKASNIEYSNQIDFKYQWSNEHFGLVLNPFLQNIADLSLLDQLTVS